ncbi:hypothetical protein L596_012154 [Steinernema carpocapsae]|uniref:F-box domain-containing protein n=1 Tax=Steinernema carpocapsae TaxID=34508 RepID=A0A4U5NX23_STECR|nr:hypothetical protein L596_012154 [Steinernema carpocapsae]
MASSSPSLLTIPDEVLTKIFGFLNPQTLLHGTRAACQKLRLFSRRYGKKIELDLVTESLDITVIESKSHFHKIGLKDFNAKNVEAAMEFFSCLPEVFTVTRATVQLPGRFPTKPPKYVSTRELCEVAQQFARFFKVKSLTIDAGYVIMDEEKFDELKLVINTFSRHGLEQFVMMANFNSRHLRYVLDLLLANNARLSNFFTLVQTKTDLQYLMDHFVEHHIRAASREFNMYIKVEESIKTEDLEQILHEFGRDMSTKPVLLKSSFFTTDLQSHIGHFEPARVFIQNQISPYLGYKVDVTSTREGLYIMPAQQFPSFSIFLGLIPVESAASKKVMTITAKTDVLINISYSYRNNIFRLVADQIAHLDFEDIFKRRAAICEDEEEEEIETKKIFVTYVETNDFVETDFPLDEKWLEFDAREDPPHEDELKEDLPFSLVIQ